MNSLMPSNIFGQGTNNSRNSSMNSTFGSTVTTAVNSTLSAVNSIGESTINAVNSIGETTVSAVNSAYNTANSIGTATIGGINSAVNSVSPSFANSNIFTNVNTSKNAFTNTNVNTGKSSSGWGMFFGVFIFLIVIFLLILIVFKDQISISWDYFVLSMRKFLGMDTPKIDASDDDVNKPIPGILDEIDKAKHDRTNIINKILPMGTKEVFNISSNDYTFYDAEPLCLALGAELANYDQVQEAWSKGADWCNYGWTKGQVAIYPTQKDTWEKLQGGPADEHTACGEPGINGGYFDNPEMRFGVNCYGVKPEQTSNDQRILMENGTIPKTISTLKIDQQIMDIKNNIDMIGVLPFNSNKWSTT